jgi:hypothetical protein
MRRCCAGRKKIRVVAKFFISPPRRNPVPSYRILSANGGLVMEAYTELRQQIGQDLDTLNRKESPKSIFEIAEDYLLGNPTLKRNIVEDIIKEEADKRNIEIH